jgi:hypothetical protein
MAEVGRDIYLERLGTLQELSDQMRGAATNFVTDILHFIPRSSPRDRWIDFRNIGLSLTGGHDDRFEVFLREAPRVVRALHLGPAVVEHVGGATRLELKYLFADLPDADTLRGLLSIAHEQERESIPLTNQVDRDHFRELYESLPDMMAGLRLHARSFDEYRAGTRAHHSNKARRDFKRVMTRLAYHLSLSRFVSAQFAAQVEAQEVSQGAYRIPFSRVRVSRLAPNAAVAPSSIDS